MLAWYGPSGRPIHILLTKSDKLSKNPAAATLQQVRAKLKDSYPQCTVQLFSSLKKTGIDEAEAVIGGWLHDPEDEVNAPDNKKPLAKGEQKPGAVNALMGIKAPLREEKRATISLPSANSDRAILE